MIKGEDSLTSQAVFLQVSLHKEVPLKVSHGEFESLSTIKR